MFSIPGENAAGGSDDNSGGYKCDATKLSDEEKKWSGDKPICEGHVLKEQRLKPGDTIEVHFVYSGCDGAEGKGLGSCFVGDNKECKDEEWKKSKDYRVEAQVRTDDCTHYEASYTHTLWLYARTAHTAHTAHTALITTPWSHTASALPSHALSQHSVKLTSRIHSPRLA